MMPRVPRIVSPMMSKGGQVERGVGLREPLRLHLAGVLPERAEPLTKLSPASMAFCRACCISGAASIVKQAGPAEPHHAAHGRIAGEALQRLERARQPLGGHEVRRVEDELVVLVGLHVLALDELVHDVVAQAVAGPLEPLEPQDLHGLRRVGEDGAEVERRAESRPGTGGRPGAPGRSRSWRP